jgi:VanZ family protein
MTEDGAPGWRTFFVPAKRHPLFRASRAIVRTMLKQILLTDTHGRLRYWTAITLYLLILILGSLPGARQDIGQVASGLILHSIAYAGLTFCCFTGGSGLRAVKAVLTIAAMGALDEYIQSFFPYRHGSVGDWAVDVSAAMVTACSLYWLWQRRTN